MLSQVHVDRQQIQRTRRVLTEIPDAEQSLVQDVLTSERSRFYCYRSPEIVQSCLIHGQLASATRVVLQTFAALDSQCGSIDVHPHSLSYLLALGYDHLG